jgi:RHS repeat-associated protein
MFIALDPNALGQPSRVGIYVNGAEYHSNGSPWRFTYGNGVQFVQELNARHLPSRITASPNVLGLSYAYDASGNVSAILDSMDAGRNRQMIYDGIGRLTQATSVAFGGDGVIRYAYDVLGNMVSAKLSGRKDHTYAYDARNRLTNVMSSDGATTTGLAYDVQGNLSMRNGQAFAFDFGNRLRSAPGPENYRYDGHGRRVLAWLQGSGSILSMYDSEGKLRRQQSERDGKIREYLYIGSTLVATLETGADGVVHPKYAHADVLGSPIATTDASGSVIERSFYDPYGELLNRGLRDEVGFSGHVSDSQNGISYMQQRYYDPVVGRFLSVDPVTAHASPMNAFNRYWYASNNPYRFIDPDGRYSCDAAMCAPIKAYVGQLRESRANLRDRREQRVVDKILRSIGTEGSPGPHYVSGELEGKTIANTNQKGTVTVDLSKVDSPKTGAQVIAHEDQHDIETAERGRPAATSDEVRATEVSAYGTEAIVAKGLGINISKDEQAKGVEGSVTNWEARQPKTEKDK